MKHLKKFNESVSESTFEDIFVDLIHQDLKLNIRPSYFSENIEIKKIKINEKVW